MFWFQDSSGGRGPDLRAAYNLSADEAGAEEFYPNIQHVFQAFRKNQPLIAKDVAGVRTVLCLPFEIQSRVQGVLYHDTTFTKESFDFLDKETLGRVARHMSGYLERIWEYSRLMEKKVFQLSGHAARTEGHEGRGIVAGSPVMERLLKQADQAADS